MNLPILDAGHGPALVFAEHLLCHQVLLSATAALATLPISLTLSLLYLLCPIKILSQLLCCWRVAPSFSYDS